MDAVAALSVAAAIVQFVDWSRKIVCKSRELYNSAEGVLQENIGSKTVTLRLKELTTTVSDELTRNSLQLASPRLRQICAECTTISDELLARLHRLEVPDGVTHRGWKSFRQALKSVWNKREIDAMATRLASLRAEIGTEILLAIGEKLALLSVENSQKLELLDSAVRNMVVTLSEKTPSEQITKSIADLTIYQKMQFRELLISTLDSRAEFQTLRRDYQELARTLIADFALAIQRTDAQFGELHVRLEADREALAFQRGMSATLMREDNEKRLKRVRLIILESLRFGKMNDRPTTVAKAHARTFEWIFRDPAASKKPWSDFAQWLRSESGIYWINGKPGSGKSTLMKFIWSHALTSAYLREWAAGRQLLTAVFFFWNSGHQSQRSHEGLFRTLLYQVLLEEPSLLPKIFPAEWKRTTALVACDLDVENEPWDTPGQLREAFEILVHLASGELRLCFFIDGLDEAEGNVDDIADFIDQMALTSPHVKFCVSSRPWVAFEAVFAEMPSLRLQDLTVDDIRLYTTDTLGASRSIRRILRHEPGKQQWLAEELVKMAMGVFLWVSLAVKLLVRGIHEGDDTEELRRRLLSLPPDLEKFYGHIFDQIQQAHPEESSKIFQLFRANGNTLDILMLSRALTYPEDSYNQVLWLELVPKTEIMTLYYTTLRERQVERWIRKLNSHCFGLLEIAGNSREVEVEEFWTPGGEEIEREEWPQLDEEEIKIDASRTPDARGRYSLKRLWSDYADRPPPRDLDPAENSASEVTSCAYWTGLAKRRAKAKSRDLTGIKSAGFWQSTDDQVTVPIRYLHRTAKDYLQDPRAWEKLVSMTAKTTFDPNAALLLAWVVKLKTSVLTDARTDVFPRDSVLNAVRNLASSASTNLRTYVLLEELHRTLGARIMDLRMVHDRSPCADHGRITGKLPRRIPGHMWRFDKTMNPNEKRPRVELAAQLLETEECFYIADHRGVPVVFAPLDQSSGPALGLALFFSQWMGWLSANKKPYPDLPDPLEGSQDLLYTVMSNDSNAAYAEISGHTIWELLIHLVHVLHDRYAMGVDFSRWLYVVQLMLHSGCDPHACCPDGDAFIQAIRQSRQWTPPLEVTEHFLVPPGLDRVHRAHVGDSRGLDDLHSYYHTVEAVVRDVFVRRQTPGAEELLATVLEKKAPKLTVGRRFVGTEEDGGANGTPR